MRNTGTSIRRRSAGAVALAMVVGGMALTLTSCSSQPTERCVDTLTYRWVDGSHCDSSPGGGYADTDRYQWYIQGGNSPYVHGYHRYYGTYHGTHHTSGGTHKPIKTGHSGSHHH
jgi:hypothetical protein